MSTEKTEGADCDMTTSPRTTSAAELSRDEKSILLYAETCVVDGSGLLSGARMNEADITALKKFKDAGILDFGRIPYRTLATLIQPPAASLTHWVTFHEPAWALAHALRRQRALQLGSNRKKVDAALAEKKDFPMTENTTASGAANAGLHALADRIEEAQGRAICISVESANYLRKALAASAPVAPAPQPADAEAWDAELGRVAMRFVDRAGDVHPGIDDAERICAEFYAAMSAVIERMPHVQRMGVAAPKAGPQPEPASIHLQDLKNALADVAELRQQLRLLEDYVGNSVWRWQADGADHLESMGARMSVLIYASDLRALLTAQPAPSAQDADPLQGAANWLVTSQTITSATTLGGRLCIGYNRAERLFNAARAQAAQPEGGA